MIREFFYLQKSDRKVILTLLCVIVIAMGVIFLTGGEEETNGLMPVDTLRKEVHRDTARRYQEKVRTVYVKTKVVYRDTAFRRGVALRNSQKGDSVMAHYQPKLHNGEHLVLNTADSTALVTVPGIGPYFARKVIWYGERLGGYVSVDQLDEITDFPTEAKQYFEIKNPQPRRININTLTLQQLRRHPYINYYQARCIVDYRRLHGRINSLQDLSLSRDFTPEAIRRLEPYVEF
jgi:DNA uptake protein ComE-like DNA-binding protein